MGSLTTNGLMNSSFVATILKPDLDLISFLALNTSIFHVKVVSYVNSSDLHLILQLNPITFRCSTNYQ